ncbi:MAG TPA: isochorismate synthase [Candidatus Obscuribacterales bacterium]
MTVAPSQPNILPHYPKILHALQVCLRVARQRNAEQIASLAFPLSPIDPLAVLLTIAREGERQCYFESPSRGQAIAAWDALITESFSGRDRFERARTALEGLTQRVKSFAERREGPYFFCSFSFFDTLTEATKGFAPATVLLTRWQIVRQRQVCSLIANVLVAPHTPLAPLARAIAEQVSRVQAIVPLQLGLEARPWRDSASPLRLSAQEASTFQQKVRQTLGAIQAQQLQKQVVAHALDVTYPGEFRRAVALPRLRSHHPDCYIFSFAGTHHNHFIGASPERLLSIRQGRLVTDALAGSAPRGQTPEADFAIGQRLLSTHKEQREHQLVLEFIIERLRAEGLVPRYSAPPGLLKLSNIQHLHTPICADVPAHLSPLTLVAALHPTPAVAGVPTRAACELIRRDEPCDRGLYAAPLGWVDPYGNSEFIVGIRSALIHKNRARLYAGAGIVIGSDPEQELAEIQLKLQALAAALG